MRVLAVGNMYPPHHLGGYEQVWRSAVDALRARGHVVRVLSSNFRLTGADGAEDDFDVHRDLRWYWHEHEFPRLSVLARLCLERQNAAVFSRHLRELRPDVVSWWAMGGMSLSLIGLCARAGIPSVAFVQDDWLSYGPEVDAWQRIFRRFPPAAGLVERLSGVPTRLDPRHVRMWVFVSTAVREAALAAGWQGSSLVAPTGISARFLVERPAEDWRWRLLYVGRLDPRKGVDVAVEAVADLPSQTSLAVAGIGDPNEERRLMERVKRLGLGDRVRFLGGQTPAELVELYAAADAIVFPVRWEEPWGLVPLEAMAVGRPVIASGRGGSGEYLRDGENCLLFDPDRPKTLAAKVRRLAAEPGLRAGLIAAGKLLAREHTEARYNEIVASTLEAAARGNV